MDTGLPNSFDLFFDIKSVASLNNEIASLAARLAEIIEMTDYHRIHLSTEAVDELHRLANAIPLQKVAAPTQEVCQPTKPVDANTRTCTYPSCLCPFDAPADPAWCALGLPKRTPCNSSN
jgi:hypothetical protein